MSIAVSRCLFAFLTHSHSKNLIRSRVRVAASADIVLGEGVKTIIHTLP